MNDIKQKREAAAAMARLVKSGAPNIEAFGELVGVLGIWTGQKVRVLITAEGQSEAVDMAKTPTIKLN